MQANKGGALVYKYSQPLMYVLLEKGVSLIRLEMSFPFVDKEMNKNISNISMDIVMGIMRYSTPFSKYFVELITSKKYRVIINRMQLLQLITSLLYTYADNITFSSFISLKDETQTSEVDYVEMQRICAMIKELRELYRRFQEGMSISPHIVPSLLSLSFKHILHRSEVPAVDSVKIGERPFNKTSAKYICSCHLDLVQEHSGRNKIRLIVAEDHQVVVAWNPEQIMGYLRKLDLLPLYTCISNYEKKLVDMIANRLLDRCGLSPEEDLEETVLEEYTVEEEFLRLAQICLGKHKLCPYLCKGADWNNAI